MKTKALLLAGLITVLSFSFASAQMLSLDHVDGLNASDGLEMGVPITFHIRVTGDNTAHGGVTNGFRVHSPTGATWSSFVGDTTGALGKTQFDGGFFVTHFSDDGAGADTVGFGGFRFFSAGMPAGFDEIAYTIQIGPIDASYNGGELCLDSTFYPPSGLWKWAGPDIFPGWTGPHCWTIGEQTTNPQITCPGDTSLFLCAPETVCFAFDTVDADWVTASAPAYIEGNQVCVPFEQPDEFTIMLIAGAGEAADTCSFSLTAAINTAPTVTMTPDSVEYVMCDVNGTICMALDLTDPDGNIVDTSTNIGFIDVLETGTYVCFSPGAEGLFDVTVTATDACGAVGSTTRRVSVIAGEVAVVDCPAPVIDTLCGAGLYCQPVAITPDTARVTVSPTGAYIPETGLLCADVSESGLYEFRLIAETECGADTCDLQLDITVVGLPVIDCPPQSPNLFLPDPGEVCLDLAIANADNVGVSYGSWVNGQLCFQADTTGVYTIVITVENICATDTCVLTPFVQVGQFEMTTIIRPDPMRMIDAYHVDPQFAVAYLGNFTDGHTVADIDPTSLVINHSIVPPGAAIIPDFPGFVGEVMEITLPVHDFIEYYMPLYDTTRVTYFVSGQYLGGGAFEEVGQVDLIGIFVGDVNLDGQIDIADLTYLIDYYYQGGPAPLVLESADMDRSLVLDISDLMALIVYMFGQ